MNAGWGHYTTVLLWFLLWSRSPTGSQADGQTDEHIKVVGMFQVKETANGQCDESKTYTPSVMAIEAIKWTFRNLYDHGDSPPLRLMPYKTCGLSEETTQNIISILSEQQHMLIAGIIGPEFSEEAKLVSELITSLPESQHIAQISYSATAQLLGDKSKFPNFFRVIPNDDMQVETMVQLMLELQWNRIAVVHDDDLYGIEVAKALQTMATANGICISTTQQVGTNTDQYQRVLDEILINANPSIKGLVLIGRQDIAHLFMKFMSKDSDLTNTPAMILSESVQLQRNAFSDTNGAIFETSKGSYVLSPDYKEVTEFADYWKGLLGNQTVLLEEQTTNPWLLDVYEERFGCRPDGTFNCPTLSNNEIDQHFAEQPLYVRYAIIAAYTMSAAIRKAVTETCGNVSLCEEFTVESPAPDVLRHMNDLRFSVDQGFGFKPTGLGDVTVSFGQSSGDNLEHGQYKVYNLRQKGNDQEHFNFVEVARYNGTNIDVTTDEIIDYYYDSSGSIQPFPWPDVRRAQCPAEHVCSECVAKFPNEDFVFMEGDLYIVALVPNRESDSEFGCGNLAESNLFGFGNSVAMQKAVRDFNGNNDFDNQRVGLVVFDSCSNPLLSDWRIKNLLKTGLTFQNGSTVFISDKILGVVASYFSSVSMAISQTLTSQRILHMAYGATSPRLSNRDVYPYFMRVVTPDQKATNVAVDVLKEMDVNYVQLIYTDDAYGKDFRDLFIINAEKEGICVANTIVISAESQSKINLVYETLRKKPFAKLVVVAVSTYVDELLRTVTQSMDSGEFLFYGSEAWGLDSNRLRDTNSFKLLGSLTVHLELPDIFDIGNTMKYIDNGIEADQPWTEEYLQSTMQCHYDLSFDKRFQSQCNQTFRQFWETNDIQINNWGPFSYLSVQSMLNGTSQFFLSKCSTKGVICDAYRDDVSELVAILKENSLVDIQGNDQLSKVFDDNGDGNDGYSVIYNIQKKTDDPSAFEYVERRSSGECNTNPSAVKFNSTWVSVPLAHRDVSELVAILKNSHVGQLSRVFDDNGDGNDDYTVIYNIQKKTDDPSAFEYVEVGRYSADGHLNLKKDLIVTQSNEEFQSTCPNKKTCDECLTASTPVSPTDTPSSKPTTTIALGVVVGVLAVVLIVMSVIVRSLSGIYFSSKPTTTIALGVVVGVLAVALIVMCVIACTLGRRIQTLKTTGDGYLTPTEVNKHFDNNVYEGQIREEMDENI